MEEYEIGETPNIDIKEIEINEGDNKYKCQIQIIKDFIQVILYSNNILKYKGNIHLSKIEYYLGIYNYNIEEIFEEINILNKDNFNIIKEMNIYKLKIEFIILRKKRYIYIELNNNSNLNENDLINSISELNKYLVNLVVIEFIILSIQIIVAIILRSIGSSVDELYQDKIFKEIKQDNND